MNQSNDDDAKVPHVHTPFSVSKEKITELRSIIDATLRKDQVYEKLRETIDKYIKTSTESSKLDKEQRDEDPDQLSQEVMQQLMGTGIVQQILSSIETEEDITLKNQNSKSTCATKTKKASVISSAKCLYLQLGIRQGRDFRRSGKRSMSNDVKSCLEIHLDFGGQQHFVSHRIELLDEDHKMSFSCQDSFILQLFHPQNHCCVSIRTLMEALVKSTATLTLSVYRVELTATREAEESTDKHESSLASLDHGWTVVQKDLLGASSALEWKQSLCHVFSKPSLNLYHAGEEGKVHGPVGTLDCTLELISSKKNSTHTLPYLNAKHMSAQLDVLKQDQRGEEAQTYERMKTWWTQYIEIHPSFRHRCIKLFAEDEMGTFRPVTEFVRPIEARGTITSGAMAARLVSLIPFQRKEQLGGGRKEEVWHTARTFLTLGKGDCEDHSTLLASLLLGLGLDAYVCIGTIQHEDHSCKPHVWVVTRNGTKIQFWESLNGKQFSFPFQQSLSSAHHYYQTIDCVFNHEHFYANKQRNNVISCLNSGGCFDFEDDLYWKQLPATHRALGDSPKSIMPVRLFSLPPPRQVILEQERMLEQRLEQGLISYRLNHCGGQSTTFSSSLSYVLTPALASYEMEKLGWKEERDEENAEDLFRASIKRTVPQGHTFQGYPVMFSTDFSTGNISTILAKMEQNAIGQKIMQTTGDAVHFAFRVQVFYYTQDIQATWVMLAVRFRPLMQ